MLFARFLLPSLLPPHPSLLSPSLASWRPKAGVSAAAARSEAVVAAALAASASAGGSDPYVELQAATAGRVAAAGTGTGEPAGDRGQERERERDPRRPRDTALWNFMAQLFNLNKMCQVTVDFFFFSF